MLVRLRLYVIYQSLIQIHSEVILIPLHEVQAGSLGTDVSIHYILLEQFPAVEKWVELSPAC